MAQSIHAFHPSCVSGGGQSDFFVFPQFLHQRWRLASDASIVKNETQDLTRQTKYHIDLIMADN